ncbi:MAG: nucleotidyltransferase domain-containing protein [Acidobacteriaceae bacterium]
MRESPWLQSASPAFRLMIATSWLAPDAWQKNQEEAIRSAIRATPDWTEYLRLVDRHSTPALSWAALKRVPGLEVPTPAKQELQKRSDACRMQAVQHSLLLAQILKAFNRAGVPVMVMKGTLLSLELYGDLGLRHARDMDLAVTLDDIGRAQTCLNDLGWRLDSSFFPMTPRQWGQFWRMEHHLGFLHSQTGCALELHWRNVWDTPELTSARWARSVPAVWQGRSYRAMCPIDQVLYLCSHGGEHAWYRAKWLGDLARLHAAGRVDWEAALAHARSAEHADQAAPLLVCLWLLQVVYGLPLPHLPGAPWKDLPPVLVDAPLHALKIAKDRTCNDLDMLPARLRLNRYERLLLPRRTWRESFFEFAYCRADFSVLRLPDGLFWAYAPLRPLLWFWRRARRGKPAEIPSVNGLSAIATPKHRKP